MAIADYRLIEARSALSLTKLIADEVAHGMQPFGPPFYNQTGASFCQAVVSGYQTTVGEPGPPGPAGPTGPAGGAAGASMIFIYRADTNSTTLSDPGVGKLRWNNVDQTKATQLMFDRLTDDNLDPILYIISASLGDRVVVQDASLSTSYQLWTKTGPGVVMPDWYYVPVSFVSAAGTGSAFVLNKRLAVYVY